MIKENELKIGGVYRHYKGNKYRVLMVVNDSDTNEDEEFRKLVIYQDLSNEDLVWARELNEFLSLNPSKDSNQVYRFELVE